MYDAAIAYGIPGLRGVGLWLLCVGAGFAVGWLLGRLWYIPAAIGAGLGGALIPFANLLSPRLPGMGWDQAPWLFAAIAAEAVAIVWLLRRMGDDEDRFIRALLLAVAAHFVPMVPAFGWPMALLAGASLLLTLVGWYGQLRVPRRALALAASALKIGFGAWMVALTTEFA